MMPFSPARSVAAVVWLGCTVAACAPNGGSFGGPDAPPTMALAPCHIRWLAEEVLCGTHEVFEDREAAAGRRLTIQVTVMPPLRRAAEPDPLVILAGGPGQGARALGAAVARYFTAIRRTRGVVLVDLRGTGDSNPLHCPAPDDELALFQMFFGDAGAMASCRETLDADPRHYTHAAALADLDEIRQRLGLRQVNLWGGSWGTRAALLYALTYPDAVRRVVLDGAVPLDMEFPLPAAHDAQRALDLLMAGCHEDAVCREAFADVQARFGEWLDQLDAQSATVQLAHPRTGQPTTLRVVRSAVAEIVRVALYSPTDAARVLQIVKHAMQGHFAPLATEFLRLTSVSSDDMATGTTLSVLCSEDMPATAAVDFAAASAHTFGRSAYADAWRERCAVWPRGPAIAASREAVSQAPALILSGLHDPVTPPRWGDAMRRHFPSSQHVVVPGAAHNASFTGCVPELIAAFLDATEPVALDARCAEETTWEPMVLADAGTRP
jgi:pimeloyl-ACP methyl ester carboxylesterase